ncbi:hypothetical protein CXF71_00190 [Colwellia sp. 12G3]|nr:hypothetical protein CXF71_00190 [Colwellia sp. 12G3]
MAGGIAHEFNNALAIISGSAEMLLGDSPDTSQKQAKRILHTTDRTSKLVKQILTFSRMDASSIKPINLAVTIQESVEMVRSVIPANIEIRQDIAGECLNIMGDTTQIHQVVVNLCMNACHAMEEKGGILQISLKNDDESLVLRVSDTGGGITQENKKRIFDPFFTTKEVDKGTGLGLSVVYRIIENHQGNIFVDSEFGIGSTFTIILPKTTEVILVEQACVDNKEGAGHILIVEDEEDLAQLYKEYLETVGYKTTVRNNGEAALSTFKQHVNRFDLVLTDNSMPKMTGEELAKELLTIRPDLPIILATGYSNVATEKKAQHGGILQYLVKPVKLGLLTQAIASCLAKDINMNSRK